MAKRIGSSLLIVIMIMALLFAGGCVKKVEGPIPGDGLPLGKFNPPVTLTYSRPMPTELVTMMDQMGDTEENNVWTREYKDSLGIELKLAFSTSGGTEYVQRLATAILTEDIPDFMNLYVGDIAYSLLKALNDSGQAADLTDIYKQYASDNLKKYVEKSGNEIFMPCIFDGRLKGLPQIIGGENDANSFYWIRKDWLDTLSLDIPETMDDFLNVCKEFTISDPDGDGQKNTYGLVVSKDFSITCSLFFNGYGSYPNTWVKGEDGKLIYGSIASETKTALAALNELYKAGYISDPKSVTANTMFAECNNGIAGIINAKVFQGKTLQDAYLKNEQAQFIPIYGISATDKPLRITAPLNSYVYYAVNSKYNHPEAAVKMLNLFIEKREDPSQEVYNKFIDTIDSKAVWKLALIPAEIPGKNLAQAKSIEEALKTGTVPTRGNDATVYTYVKNYLDGDKNYWGWNAIYGEGGSEGMVEKYFDEGTYLVSQFNAAPTPSMELYIEELKRLEAEAFLSIVTGEKPVDYFNAFVEQWLNSGGREITEEVNAWAANYKPFE